MEWPISWNDVKNGLLPVVEISTSCMTSSGDGVTLSDVEGVALSKAAATGMPIVVKLSHGIEAEPTSMLCCNYMNSMLVGVFGSPDLGLCVGYTFTYDDVSGKWIVLVQEAGS